METSTVAKALSGGTVGVGVIGSAGYGIHVLTTKSDEPKVVETPRTIRDKLRLEGEDILPTDNDTRNDDWKKLVEENKALTNDQADRLVLADNDDEENIGTMKSTCSALLDTELGDANTDMTLNQTRRWCVKKKG